MRVWVLIAMLLPLFFACNKKEQSDVQLPLVASMSVTDEGIRLLLSTEYLYGTPGYMIHHREASKGDKQCVILKYVYKRADSVIQVMAPATMFIYATAEPEQKFKIKYKNHSANLTVRYDGANYTIESDNPSFIHP